MKETQRTQNIIAPGAWPGLSSWGNPPEKWHLALGQEEEEGWGREECTLNSFLHWPFAIPAPTWVYEMNSTADTEVYSPIRQKIWMNIPTPCILDPLASLGMSSASVTKLRHWLMNSHLFSAPVGKELHARLSRPTCSLLEHLLKKKKWIL